MRKIGFTLKFVAYASSMVLSIGIFGSYNMLLSVTPSNVPEIPVINLDTISPVISSTDYAESANPFGTISVTGAGAGVARMGMGGTQGVSTPTPQAFHLCRLHLVLRVLKVTWALIIPNQMK